MNERYGEVFDRGYKPYEGPRLGRRHAVWALTLYSMKRAMGIKKGWTSKIVPFVIYAAAALTALVPVGIESFINRQIMQYDEFFGALYLLEGIFVATIAPELLCGDRRENVLSLYFSRAMTQLDYLVAKVGAAALLTLTISFIPAFVLWLGRRLLAEAPLASMWGSLPELGKLIFCGTMIAFYLGTIGLMISSFTGRKSIAVAVIVLGFFTVEALVGILQFALENETLARYVSLVSPTNVTGGLVLGLFRPEADSLAFSYWIHAMAMATVVTLASAVMYRRYVRDT
jgi:ABC-2 type transport system permease protein